MKTCTLVFSLTLFLFSCNKNEDDYTPRISHYPISFDLRQEGILTPAKDQGSYGTCWSFACAGLVESWLLRNLGTEVDLSEQHLINCAGFGPFDGLEYLQTTGIVSEDVLSYKGNAGNCINQNGVHFKINSYSTLNLQGLQPVIAQDTIKYALTNFGAVLTHMDGLSSLSNYRTGVYLPGNSETTNVGHIILIVGWQNDPDIENGGYWICKNSYGTSFGEDGYFNIAYQKANIANAYAVYLQ